MDKLLAIVLFILVIWVAVPHVRANEWIAPAAAPYDHWAYAYAAPGSRELLSTPPNDYGWYRYDVWNNPPAKGRPAVKDDFRLQPLWR